MRLTDYLDPHLIMLDLPALDKSDVFAHLADRLVESKLISDRDAFLTDVYRRETQGCTAIGRGLAIPHARTKTLKRITVSMARLRAGVDFAAEDGEPVRLVFLLATPEGKAGEYLKVLARLSKLLRENGLPEKLLHAGSVADVLAVLEKAECKLP